MKEIVSKILEVIMCLIPFFGKGKRERVVREVRYNATHTVSGDSRAGGITITCVSRGR